MREGQLDRPRLGVHVEIEVMRAAHERAGTRHRGAHLASDRPLDVIRINEQLREPSFVAGQPLGGDRLRTNPSITPRRVNLAANPRDLWLWRVFALDVL